MYLILQGIRVRVRVQVQVQVLKSCKSIQESSEKMMFIKSWQISRQLYISRITKFRLPSLFFTHIQVICVGFLFSQPWTYIRIILRAVKGDVTWFKVIIHSNYDRRQFVIIHLSLEEATSSACQGFCNQWVSLSSSCGWTEELCSQHLSQFMHVLKSMHQLVSHILGAVHWNERLSLHYKSNCVLE